MRLDNVRKIIIFAVFISALFQVTTIYADSNTDRALKIGLISNKDKRGMNENITKGRFCDIIEKVCELSEVKLEEGDVSFTDTESKAVQKLYKMGIVNGEGENIFGANNILTRETMCTILHRVLNKIYGVDSSAHKEFVFGDNSFISYWAKDSVDYLFDIGLLKGTGNNKIDPKGKATVEQAVQLALRIYDNHDEYKKERSTNSDYKWEIEPIYDGIGAKTKFACGLAAVAINNKFGYINNKGEKIVDFIYDRTYDFSDGIGRVEKDGKTGYVSAKGDLIIPCIYDSGGDFTCGRCFVELNGKYGFINSFGEIVIPFEYDYAYGFNGNMAPVKKNGAYGYIDIFGNVVIDFKFEWATSFSEDFARVEKDFEFGYIDRSGKLVCDYKYDYAYDFSCGVAVVYDMDRYAVINRNMKYVVEPQIYRPISSASNGVLKVHKHGVWEGAYSFITTDGELILPFENSSFYNLSDFHEGLGCGAWHSNTTDRVYRTFIDKKGNCILPKRKWYSEILDEVDDDFFYMGDMSEGMVSVVNQEGKMGFMLNPLFN